MNLLPSSVQPVPTRGGLSFPSIQATRSRPLALSSTSSIAIGAPTEIFLPIASAAFLDQTLAVASSTPNTGAYQTPFSDGIGNTEPAPEPATWTLIALVMARRFRAGVLCRIGKSWMRGSRLNTKLLGTFALLIAAATASKASAQGLLTFDNLPGHYLVEVSGGNGTTGYDGYAANFNAGPGFGSGPAIPGGLVANLNAFFDLSTGNFGVSGSGPGVTGNMGATVLYTEAFQFAGSGTFTVTSHFQGFVGSGPRSNQFIYEYAHLAEFVGIRDDTLYGASGFDQVASGDICAITTPGINGCSTPMVYSPAAPTATLNTDLVVSEFVVPGHIYTVQVTLSGTQIGGFTYFDGIDPSTISVALSPGLTFAPTPGLNLPGFIAPPVPEPGTLGLFALGLASVGLARRRQGN